MMRRTQLRKHKIAKKQKELRKRTIVTSKIRTGDTVMVISGASKGNTGAILSVNHEAGSAVVQGLNLKRKHVKKSQDVPQGGIISYEAPIHISNLMVCVDQKPVKLKTKVGENGERFLVYKDGENEVIYRSLTKQNP